MNQLPQKLSISKKNNHIRELLFFSACLAALTVKVYLFGFLYFPMLDDYIQYDVYQMFPPAYIFKQAGTIYTRPLAALFDIYIWGPLWPHLNIALAILTCLHFLSGLLLYDGFRRLHQPVGSLFFVIYFLFPLHFEGVYWVSAATRVVCGMLFAALSFWCVTLYLNRQSNWMLILFGVFGLFACGFYEQAAITAALLAVYAAAVSHKWKLLWIPAAYLAVTAVYYFAFSHSGNLSGRVSPGLSLIAIAQEAVRVVKIFTVGTFQMIKNGVVKGVHLYANMPVMAAITLVLSALLAWGLPHSKARAPRRFLFGLLFAALPLAPFFLLKNSYTALRNTFFSCIGIALIFDMLPRKKVVCFVTALIFMAVSACELDQYRQVYETDRVICQRIVQSGLIEPHKSYYLIGAKPCYVEANWSHAEHLKNVTSSDWALTGAVRSYANDKDIQLIVPVEDAALATNPDYIRLYMDDSFHIFQ